MTYIESKLKYHRLSSPVPLGLLVGYCLNICKMLEYPCGSTVSGHYSVGCRRYLHSASPQYRLNKYDLLQSLAERLGRKDIQLIPDDDFVCDRSLDGSRFTAETGYIVPS